MIQAPRRPHWKEDPLEPKRRVLWDPWCRRTGCRLHGAPDDGRSSGGVLTRTYKPPVTITITGIMALVDSDPSAGESRRTVRETITLLECSSNAYDGERSSYCLPTCWSDKAWISGVAPTIRTNRPSWSFVVRHATSIARTPDTHTQHTMALSLSLIVSVVSLAAHGGWGGEGDRGNVAWCGWENLSPPAAVCLSSPCPSTLPPRCVFVVYCRLYACGPGRD